MRNPVAELVVGWYRQHGAHPDRRIAKDRDGEEFVIGDFSWHGNTANPREHIEGRIRDELGGQIDQIMQTVGVQRHARQAKHCKTCTCYTRASVPPSGGGAAGE